MRELWSIVLLDCLAAACSVVPILNIPGAWYLLMNHSVTWVQFREAQEKTFWKTVANTVRIVLEVVLWVWISQCGIRAWMDLHHFLKILSDKNASEDQTRKILEHVIRYTQVNFIRSSLCVCTVFFWRSFKRHADFAEKAVADQKAWHNDKMKKRRKHRGFNRAIEVLDVLKSKEPWSLYFKDPRKAHKTEHEKTPPEQGHGCSESELPAQELRQPGRPLEPAEPQTADAFFMNRIIVVLSTLCLASGVFLMSVGPELQARNELFDSTGSPFYEAFSLGWWWVNMLVSLTLMSDGWSRLIWSLLKATDKFRDNITQVLIFSCLGRLTSWSHLSRGLESYSHRNRCRAKRLLRTYAKEVTGKPDPSSSGDPIEQKSQASEEKKINEMLKTVAKEEWPCSRMFPCCRVAPALTCGDAKLFNGLLQRDSCQLSFAREHDLQA